MAAYVVNLARRATCDNAIAHFDHMYVGIAEPNTQEAASTPMVTKLPSKRQQKQ